MADMTRAASLRLPVPGPACGDYPERPEAALRRAGWHALIERLAQPASGRARQRLLADVRSVQSGLPPAGSADFELGLRALRAQLGARGFAVPLVAEAFACVALCAEATLGLAPYDTQLAAAQALLDNRLVEMATGEGKTLAVALAGATAALAGVPVHVVTANPYLAARDAAELAPLYAALGLSVAALAPGDAEPQRRTAYRCDIVYASARELIFDYLRDRTRSDAAAAPLLRGLCMAIVDEADSVLIDEARTPFVLAEERHDAAAAARHGKALALARALQPALHFGLDAVARRATLTPAGRERVAAAAGGADPLWRYQRFVDEVVERALAALHLFRRDVHYLVRDGRVEIIDATTGRVATGRRWSQGLHQLIELKEGCDASPLQVTTAQLTYQRYFPRYWRLAGLSGTLREARAELRQVYGLAVEALPLRLLCRRLSAPPQIYADAVSRWQAAVDVVLAAQAAGRPVLIGTDSVADAQRLAERLSSAGVPCQRLDAHQDADEATRIAQAGAAGCVTVTTQLAGRGTDIRLGTGVAERGGLLVLSCQVNASARIDRQLHGRCARAGDPGAVITTLSLDEGMFRERLSRRARALLGACAGPSGTLPGWLAAALLRVLQASQEWRARRDRARLLQADTQTLKRLGFGARIE